MAIPIKIQCGCGQRYSFETEPVDGRMATTVACPACGADGTSAADAIIAQSFAPEPAPPPRVSVPAHAPPPPGRAPSRRLPGQLDPDQALHEAKAKISWGDDPKSVIGFLMMQGFSAAEARSLVDEMFRERIKDIRANGIKNIAFGSFLVALPIVAFIAMMAAETIYVKILAVAIMAGLWGIWVLITGIVRVVAPKTQGGDVTDD